MNKQALLMQLQAVRSSLEASHDAIEAAMTLLMDEEKPAGCQHKDRTDTTTMGGPRSFVCNECGFDSDAAESPA